MSDRAAESIKRRLLEEAERVREARAELRVVRSAAKELADAVEALMRVLARAHTSRKLYDDVDAAVAAFRAVSEGTDG